MSGWTVHGGRLGAARRAFPDAPEPWVDLSTGINPRPWPGIDSIALDWHKLPEDGELAALEAAAAAHFGVEPRHVCALPGSELGLRMLARLPLPRPAFLVAPGYSTHGEAFADARPITRGQVAEVAARQATVLLANPNNPDGHRWSPAQLTALVHSLADAGGWLVVDEAFVDALPDASMAAAVAEDMPLLLFRSFGKFFGLAGLRLGFAVGPTAMIVHLRRALGSWPLSSAALRIGAAAYRDAAWIAATRARLPGEGEALAALLAGHGLRVLGECPLFRLVETEDANALFERLARRGILTRPFEQDSRWLRFGLPGDAEARARLDQALGHG